MRKLFFITGIIFFGIFFYFFNKTSNEFYMNKNWKVGKEVNPTLNKDNLRSIKNDLDKVKNKAVELNVPLGKIMQ